MRPETTSATKRPAADAQLPKFRRWWGQFPGWPAVPSPLWVTLAVGLVAALNLRWQQEIWPHTPQAPTCWAVLLVGAMLLLLPQGLWMGWRWVQGYRGPAVLWAILRALYLGGSALGLVLWFLICFFALIYCLDKLRPLV